MAKNTMILVEIQSIDTVWVPGLLLEIHKNVILCIKERNLCTFSLVYYKHTLKTSTLVTNQDKLPPLTICIKINLYNWIAKVLCIHYNSGIFCLFHPPSVPSVGVCVWGGGGRGSSHNERVKKPKSIKSLILAFSQFQLPMKSSLNILTK